MRGSDKAIRRATGGFSLAAEATFATVPFVLPEARAALRALRSG